MRFVDADGRVFEGARAIVELLALASRWRWMRWGYLHVPLVARLGQWAYERVSSCRECAEKISKMLGMIDEEQ